MLALRRKGGGVRSRGEAVDEVRGVWKGYEGDLIGHKAEELRLREGRVKVLTSEVEAEGRSEGQEGGISDRGTQLSPYPRSRNSLSYILTLPDPSLDPSLNPTLAHLAPLLLLLAQTLP